MLIFNDKYTMIWTYFKLLDFSYGNFLSNPLVPCIVYIQEIEGFLDQITNPRKHWSYGLGKFLLFYRSGASLCLSFIQSVSHICNRFLNMYIMALQQCNFAQTILNDIYLICFSLAANPPFLLHMMTCYTKNCYLS